MKGLLRILFAAIIVCLSATMFLAMPASQAQAVLSDASMTPVDKHNRGNTPAPKISYGQAEEIALKATGGGYVKDIDIEYEHRYGRLIYEVEVRKDYSEFDVDIDAETGEVLRVKRD